ncbi:MAG: response regulator [Flavobacteriales bacterium]|nr:response regulator [Flavobacteriales bacterium]
MKILIVEDEAISAEGLESALKKMGYQIIGIAADALSALDLITNTPPDLAILDINIQGDKDGVWLAEQIKHRNIPYIFLTAYGDKKTIERAIKTQPYGYLIIPFTKSDIFAAIEVAISNFNKLREEEPVKANDSNQKGANISLYVKEEHLFIRINFDDIIYLQANGNYLNIHTINKRYVVRDTIKSIKHKLPYNQFYQTHRSYVVNSKRIERFGGNFIEVNNTVVPLSSSYKEDLIKRLNIH